jgi:hypothetical protein
MNYTMVTFYLPNYPKLSQVDQLDPFSAWKEMPRGEGFWILQTYCLLKYYGANVRISDQLPNDGIVVFHRRNKNYIFSQPAAALRQLVLVGCRGDLHDLLIADLELLQNSYFENGKSRFAMPHWPMPNIVPRDSSRGSRIKRIAFKGFAAQLNEEFRSSKWLDYLKEKDLEWIQDGVEFTFEGKSTFDDSAWNDYSTIDLVLAVRPNTNELHTNKPPLKLTNAWLAGVPALLGAEIAYRETGVNGEDYLEIMSVDDAINAINYLIDNPSKYLAMIESGKNKAVNYTHEAVAKAWISFFERTPELYKNRMSSRAYKYSKYLPIGLRYRLIYIWKMATCQRMR